MRTLGPGRTLLADGSGVALRACRALRALGAGWALVALRAGRADLCALYPCHGRSVCGRAPCAARGAPYTARVSRPLTVRLAAGALEIVRPVAPPRDLAVLGRALIAAGLRATSAGWSAVRPADLLCAAPAVQAQGWSLAPADDAAVVLAAAREARDDGAAWRPPGLDIVEAELARRGWRIRPYQLEGGQRIAQEPGLLLADSPGLGKTLQRLVALRPGGRMVVAGPKNAIPEWEAQIAQWRPDLRVRRAKGRGGMPAPDAGEVCLGTLESLAPVPPDLGPETDLTCDEAHSLKGDTAQRQRFLAWRRAAQASGGRVTLLTGTPISNADPEELWRILDACGRAEDTLGPAADLRRLFAHSLEVLEVPDRSPRAKAAVERILRDHGARGFGQLTPAERAKALALAYRRVERVRWTGEHSPDVAARLRRAVLRRTKEQVAPDLPPLERHVRHVRVAPGALADLQAADLRRHLAADLDAAERASKAGDGEAVEALGQTPAIATARRLLAHAKLPALHEILDELEEAGEPVLVFSSHVDPLLELVTARAAAVSTGEPPTWGAVHGGTDADARAALRDRFQAGGMRGLALSIRAASEALTLTRAAYVVFLDLDWVPSKNEQAEARAHRIGQTRPVTVARLVADHPVDRRIAALLQDKGQFQAALLAAMESASGHADTA